MSNTFGKIYKLTSFGESHGVAIGGVIDGMPSGVLLDIDFIQKELNRRRPGQSSITTPRDEEDKIEIISGMFEGVTTGMPLAFTVKNSNHNSRDYDAIKDIYRPSHADFTWHMKYGVRDHRGGGRSSAREHVSRVVAGAIAKQILAINNIFIDGYTSQIGSIILERPYSDFNPSDAEHSLVRCPDVEVAAKMIELVKAVNRDGDSIGGVVSCVIRGVSRGLGEPIFNKFQSRLASAMLSINASKGFEYGMGFNAATMRGSEHNDAFIKEGNEIRTETNRSGGIQGGVTNGEDIFFKVAFKPISTISKSQRTVDINGTEIDLSMNGRHDCCAVIRAVPVVEAMSAMVTLDMLLEAKLRHV